MKQEDSGIPKNRKSHLLKMAAKVAIKQGEKLLKNHPNSQLKTLLDQADIVVQHAGRLKGAAMKVVQSLSVEGQDFLPPEVIQVLEKLQSQAPPVDNNLLMEELKKELGLEKFSQLKNLSIEPIASASIGQVYAAEIDDQPVVVKVQYPGVAESVDSDIDMLKKILKGALLLGQKKMDLNDLMEEVRRVLKVETDYRKEMEALVLYKKLFKGTLYRVPDVFEEFSTSKVLVLSREEGLEFTSWLAQNPTGEQRQKIAKMLLDLYIKEFFENHLVQTDPNPANFLVTNDDRLVLLDFGATVSYEDSFVTDYRQLLRCVFVGEDDEIMKRVFAMGLLDQRESDKAVQAMLKFLKLSLLPFSKEQQPFDFSSDVYSHQVRREVFQFTKLLKYSPPPKKLIFLHRKLGGIFMLLKKMQVQMDLTKYRNLIVQ